jgi:hypothetical protein
MSWQQHIFFNLFFIAVNIAGISGDRAGRKLKTLYNQAKPKTCINE